MTTQVRKSFLDRDMLLAVREAMLKMHVYRNKLLARSGFTLEHEGWLFDRLAPLTELATAHFGVPGRLKPDWSSCQLVRPEEGLELAPHQDVAALEILHATDQGCIFWIPLDDLTRTMPTISYVRDEVPILAHQDDGRGVSVIRPELVDARWTWRVLSDLRVGDVVRMDALTVHRTFVPDVCTEARLSLDVRAKPA